MKIKPLLLLIVGWAILVNGCATRPGINSAPVEYSTDTISSITPVPVATDTPTPIPMLKECWEPEWQMVWANNHELRSMDEGPEGVFWFLTTSTLDRMSAEEESYQSFDLKKMLQCEKCQEIIYGPLVISASNEAWVGLSTGLLIVDKNGAWRQITAEEVLPSADKSWGWHVLLSDNDGNIWVSHKDNLCSFDSSRWQCHQIEGVWDTDEINGVRHDSLLNGIVSAVSGQDHQVWFGTVNGRIIWFDGKQFEVYNLLELLGRQGWFIGDLAFDRQTGKLWALNTSTEPGGGTGDPDYERMIGVLQRTPDGNWHTFKKMLFIARADLPYDRLTSIAITQDGTVWVGMARALALVYYDGQDWKTRDGKLLPIQREAGRRIPLKPDCSLPDDYVIDIFATGDGHLLIGNQVFAFINQRP